jgi:hypothetical protein
MGPRIQTTLMIVNKQDTVPENKDPSTNTASNVIQKEYLFGPLHALYRLYKISVLFCPLQNSSL